MLMIMHMVHKNDIYIPLAWPGAVTFSCFCASFYIYLVVSSPKWQLFIGTCRSSTGARVHTPPASCDRLDMVEASKCKRQQEKSQTRVDLIKLLSCHSEIDSSSWSESRRVPHRTARRRSSFVGLLWCAKHQYSLSNL